LFITNRHLHDYPLYLFILFLTFIVSLFLLRSHSIDPLHDYINLKLTPIHWIVDIIRNLTLIICPDYFIKLAKIPNFLFIPQTWTLQLEILFYFISPFIFKRSSKFIILLIIFILVVDYLVIFPKQLFYSQPIVFRFMESISFFLMGGLSYKLYSFIETKPIHKKYMIALFLLFVLFTAFYNYLHIQIPFIKSHHHTDWFYYFALLFSIPLLFRYTKNIPLDNFIGELSYPMYISHNFIILVIGAATKINIHSSTFSLVTIIGTVIFSTLLVLLVDKPLDSYRQKRLTKTI